MNKNCKCAACTAEKIFVFLFGSANKSKPENFGISHDHHNMSYIGIYFFVIYSESLHLSEAPVF